jgi:hypothetical protein
MGASPFNGKFYPLLEVELYVDASMKGNQGL